MGGKAVLNKTRLLNYTHSAREKPEAVKQRMSTALDHHAL